MTNKSAKPFRPSLACGDATWEDFERLLATGETFYASPKLDGIRSLVRDLLAVSRSLKPIRNEYVQKVLSNRLDINGFDGELVVGAPCGEGVFHRSSSGIMSEFGKPDFKFYVFDHCYFEGVYYDRFRHLEWMFQGVQSPHIELLPQVTVESLKHLEELEQYYIDQGYEGAIVRWAGSPYKQGRSTLRERYMLKLKRFQDSEAVITGFEELMHNDNEAQTDALGYTRRSSHKDNKRPGNTLGKLVVQDIHNPQWQPRVGSGFDAALRQKIWQNQESYKNRVIKYKFLPCGTLEQPRHPVFLGFRDQFDFDLDLDLDLIPSHASILL